MDDLTKTLSDLQNKAENCSKSDRLIALNFLKKLINNLENVEDETLDGISEDLEEPVKCIVKKSECNKDSRHKSPLKLTIRKFKPADSNFVCHDCHKNFTTMKKMISHILNSHSKAEVTCRICKGTFYCHNLLTIHECLCPKQTVFIHRQCGICSILFLQKREYHLHMKDEHMITLDKFYKSFSCPICQSNFQLRSQLLAHTSQVHKETCPTMSESTNNVRNENSDLTVNSTSKSNKTTIKSRNWCTVCKRNFLSQKALNKHFLSYMHKVNAGELKMFKKFVCDVCGNSFNKMICLQRHVSSHHNELAHKCNLCDYRTSEKCNLAEHMRRHYQIRNFACEFCEARFIAKRELKDHVAFKHNSLRPFECSDCGKLFKTKRILRRHAKTHSEFRPYVCACGSSFLRMTNLRRHHLSVHHEASPTITKIQVADDPLDGGDRLKDYWYADSKYITNKKTTSLSLSKTNENIVASKETLSDINNVDKSIAVNPSATNLQIINVNYVLDSDKDPKMYWSVNQNFLDQSEMSKKYNNSPLNVITSNTSVIEDSMNICDLVSSPSYPLLVSADQSEDCTNGINGNNIINNGGGSGGMKSENMSKYKVESIMMETENRSNIDSIWRPIDPTDPGDPGIVDDQSGFTTQNNAGLISSFNEVFLTSVNNQCYPDDNGQWSGLSLSHPSNSNYNGDHSQYLYTESGSACEPLCDSMPVSDPGATVVDNFLYYNQAQHQNQSFAYIESYSSSVNHVDHHDHFCGGLSHPQSYHQSSQGLSASNSHLQDIFSLSYPGTSSHEFIQAPPPSQNSSSIFNQEHQLFHSPSQLTSSMTATYQPHWQQQSPLNEYSSASDSLPPLILDSYKISSQIALPSSSSSSVNHPLRILSPIDFFVSDNVFSSSGLKQEYCLSLQDPDFCGQSHHQFGHNSAQLCSKNFSVVNLISTGGCAAPTGSKDPDDSDLLYSGPDDSVM